jgi:hypothetical protein
MHPYPSWPFLTDPSHPTLSAIFAVLMRGCLSLLVVLPIVWRTRRRVLGASLAFVGGFALDLDHAIRAGSFDPRKLEHLPGRPGTHSLVIALVVAMLAFVLTRHELIAWSAFAVVVAHLLFDAAGGGERWLYPLHRPDAIPWILCPIGIAALTVTSEIAGRRVVPAPSSPARLPRWSRLGRRAGLGRSW